MKKLKILIILSLILVVSALCGTLVACGGGVGGGDKVTITYYKSVDGAPLTMKVDKNDDFSFSVIPTKEYHKFKGMYETPDGLGTPIINEYGQSTIVFTSDMTLYMVWEPLVYTLEFDAGEGTIANSQETMQVAYGGAIYTMPLASREGYNFIGWKSGDIQYSNGTTVKEGKTTFSLANYKIPKKTSETLSFEAVYELKKLKVTFEYLDLSIPSEEIEIEYGHAIPNESFPKKDTGDKEVVYWSLSSDRLVGFNDVVTYDMTFYAVWKRYSLISLYEDVTGTPTTRRVFENEPQDAPYPNSRLGYDFWGWCSSPSLNDRSPIDKLTYGMPSKNLYARWDMKTYTLRFEANGGVCDTTPLTYTIEDELELPTPTKTNYTFVGWCTRSDLTDSPRTKIRTGTAEITKLYAKYKGEDKKVLLDAGETNVFPPSKKIEYGTSYTLPVPSLNEYVFMGWYDAPNGNGNQITKADGSSISNMSFDALETQLYAYFKQKLYITVNVNLPDAGKTTVKEYYLEGDSVKLTATLNTGYEFDGWYINENLVESQLVYEFTMGASYITIDLTYDAIEYTVTFNAGEGTCSSASQDVSFGEHFTFPVAERSGYRFVGWTLNGKIVADHTGKSLKKWDTASNVTLFAFFYEDDGNTIFVYDQDSFNSIRDNPSGAYVLVIDIDMKDFAWTPFEFKGTFVGNDFKVSNLSVTSSSGGLGVFTKVSGSISNVVFDKLTVKSTSYNHVNVGGVCAELTGTLSNVKVYGSVTGDYCRIGGLVGYMSAGTITDCENHANVSTKTIEKDNVAGGGIVAYYVGGSINNCSNYGEVSVKRYAGGIIGSATAVSFENLTNYGKVISEFESGGVIGLINKNQTYTVMSKLTNEGEVVGKERVGGIVGRFYHQYTKYDNSAQYTLKISNWANSGKVSGTTEVGGIIGSLYANADGSYSTATVTVTMQNLENTGEIWGTYYVGGIIGYGYTDNGSSQLVSSLSSARIIADAYVGGLAGKVEHVQIIDCSNEDSTVNSTGYALDGTTQLAYIGGYVGLGYYIKGCDNAVEITYNEKGNFVGGIAGQILSSIEECSNTATIYAPNSAYVGGVVGSISCLGSYTVANLENSGNITGANLTGGLIGEIWNYRDAYDHDSHYTMKLKNIDNSGKVTGLEKVGGTVGNIYTAVVGSYAEGSTTINASNMNNTGDVTGKYNVGGIFGYAYSDNGASALSNSSSSANITAEAYVGGIAGQLQNVKMSECSNENSTVTAKSYYLDGTTYEAYLGGYVGYGYYVESCDNEVELTYDDKGRFVGGIAGRLTNAIVNCDNSANITAIKSNYVGGIVGQISCLGTFTLQNLTNSGAITGNDCVGGVIGEVYSCVNSYDYDSAYTVTITKNTNSGNVMGDYNNVGGIVGHFEAWITGSYAEGYVVLVANILTNTGDIEGNYSVGGLFGYASTDHHTSSLSNSTSTANITASAYVGGVAGQLHSVKLSECSNEDSTLTITGNYSDGTNYYLYVGGYVGYGYYVEECDNAVEINTTTAGSYVGGIAGFLSNAVVGCTNTANVTTTNSSYVGGIVGQINCLGSYTLSGLNNSGNVTGKEFVAGLVGGIYNYINKYDYDSHYTLSINNSSNSGNISGTNNVAGTFGYIYARIDGSYADGSVKVVVTQISNSGNITASANNAKVGSLIGYVETDNSGSKLEYFTSESYVNGEYASNSHRAIGGMNGFTIGNAS